MTSGRTELAVIGRLFHHDAHALAALVPPYAEASVVCAPDVRWPSELRTSVVAHKGLKPLRGSARLRKLVLLECGGEHWVVRRSAGEAIASLVGGDVVRLVPAPLCDRQGLLDEDWVLLDVRSYAPMDRVESSFTPVVAGAPHASLIAAVERPRWTQDTMPPAPLFRVAEAPELLCARPEVTARLLELLGPGTVLLDPPFERPSVGGKPCSPLGSHTLHRGHPGVPTPAWPHDEATGLAAARAYFRLARGQGESGDRALVCRSPVHAYHLARSLDREPRDETRAGALLHPRYAALYARDVDGAPRPDTRAAALTERAAAHFYLAEVERASSPAFESVLGAAHVRAMFEEIPDLRATATPPPEPFPASWLTTVPSSGSTGSAEDSPLPKPRRRK